MTTAAATQLEFSVIGTPRTKGSLRPIHRKRADGQCYVSLIEQGGFELEHWRTLVATAAKKAIGHEQPLAGPLAVYLHFYLPRPASQKPDHKASAYAFGGHRDDLDKLTRLALDAMTDAALYEDDSQVAELHAQKRYGDDQHPTGVIVLVEALDG